MTLGSLFDGSGGFPLAGVLNGITPLWSSEIESYPIRVTSARFPDVKQLGSVLDINGAEIEPVDIITFGSPCQDLSVAGKQLGIHEGQRSNLFFEAIRIIKEMRNADRANGRADVDIRPRFAVWENVPGAFSSNGGEDFRAVLEAFKSVCDDNIPIPRPKRWGRAGEMVGDGWSLAWRVYDAQYWGVPQRRKRIYLVADFAGERAGEILFECESMCGNPAEGAAAREGATADAERSVGGSCGVECLNPWDGQNMRLYDISGVYPTFRNNDGGGGRCDGVCYALKGNFIDRDTRQNGIGWRNGEMYTLDATDRHSVVYPDTARTLTAEHDGSWCVDKGPNVVCYDARGNGCGEIAMTMTGDHESRVTDYTAICVGNGQRHQLDMGDKTGALNCMHDQQAVVTNGKPPRKYIVRRLTPTECARLQGFPDWWTSGVEGSDSAQYKMWGNGIALPCAVDVLGRIARAVKEEST